VLYLHPSSVFLASVNFRSGNPGVISAAAAALERNGDDLESGPSEVPQAQWEIWFQGKLQRVPRCLEEPCKKDFFANFSLHSVDFPEHRFAVKSCDLLKFIC
jgi:hypothetical protein